jgi:shikimate kinase
MSIVLIGYRGSGKTSLGRRLADRLWWAFADSDEEIVKRAGKSIREMFEQDGEPAFRDLEATVVADLAARPEHVLSVGGGAILRPANREAIRAGGANKIIYLRCDAQVLHDRIHADTTTATNRPSLTNLGGGLAEIKTLLAEREPLYREIATAELDVTNLTIEEAVGRVARMV